MIRQRRGSFLSSLRSMYSLLPTTLYFLPTTLYSLCTLSVLSLSVQLLLLGSFLRVCRFSRPGLTLADSGICSPGRLSSVECLRCQPLRHHCHSCLSILSVSSLTVTELALTTEYMRKRCSWLTYYQLHVLCIRTTCTE